MYKAIAIIALFGLFYIKLYSEDLVIPIKIYDVVKPVLVKSVNKSTNGETASNKMLCRINKSVKDLEVVLQKTGTLVENDYTKLNTPSTISKSDVEVKFKITKKPANAKDYSWLINNANQSGDEVIVKTGSDGKVKFGFNVGKQPGLFEISITMSKNKELAQEISTYEIRGYKIEVKDGNNELQTFGNNTDDFFAFISNEPKMPEINVKVNVGSDYKNKITYSLKNVYVNYLGRREGTVPVPSGYRAQIYEFIANEQTKVDNNATVNLFNVYNFSQIFCGGRASLIFKIDDYSEETFDFHIRGKNPTRDIVYEFLNNNVYNKESNSTNLFNGAKPWFITRLIRHESSSSNTSLTFNQFNTGDPIAPAIFNNSGTSKIFYNIDEKDTLKQINLLEGEKVFIPRGSIVSTSTPHYYNGCPLWGTPDGFGVMQNDPPPRNNPTILWNWKENVKTGVRRLEGKRTETYKKRGADPFWKEQVRQYNAYLNTVPPPTDPSLPPEDKTYNDITFSYGTGTTGYPETSSTIKSFRDAIWIKLYNGGSRGNFVTWKNPITIPPTKPEWGFNPTNSDNVNYVEEVCKKTE